jgi:hypothetical protein
MASEFQRQHGNLAVSSRGFEVEVTGGMEVTVHYREPGRQTKIPAERLINDRIGLFMDWAEFPAGATPEEKREIFERVVHALRFMKIPIGATELGESSRNWPLPAVKEN